MLVAPTSELEQEWETVQDLLRDEVGETAYTTWLQPLAPAEVDGDRVVVGAPTPFLRDWVVAHYADRIRSAWHHVNPRIRKVALDVRQDVRGQPKPTASSVAAGPAPASGAQSAASADAVAAAP
ncbi:MAG: DnaA N-terminal domain-containing protein, partial [Alphaproteobacteria bacterium]